MATGVEVLAAFDGHPVVVRDGNVLAVAFHPELTDDSRLHARLLAMCTAARDHGARSSLGLRVQMRDPRVDALAQILVNYSTGVKPEETSA